MSGCNHCKAVQEAQDLRNTIKQQREIIQKLKAEIRTIKEGIHKLNTLVEEEGYTTRLPRRHGRRHQHTSNSSSSIASPSNKKINSNKKN